jgi:sulfite reductase (NADPH) flavoprotein alpha-component
MGGCLNGSSGESRGAIKIVFSSTSGTSKKAAGKLQQLLEDNRYRPTVLNIGDLDREELKSPQGTTLFLLSTYGNGDSPADGETFLKWVESLKLTNEFQGLEYAILAFGNSDFENHCGFGLRTEKQLKAGGARELLPLTKCDSSSKTANF